jgi:hypothetical protein
MNVLLVFVPIGVAAGALGWAVVTVFFLNFLAIISLAPLMTFSTGELSASVGRVLGGLLKEILGNGLEMIVRHLYSSVVLYFAFFCLTRLGVIKIGIIAVSRGQIQIVQSILVGSILSDSLLVNPSRFASIHLLIGVFLGSGQHLFFRWLRQRAPRIQQDSHNHHVISDDGRVRLSDRSNNHVLYIGFSRFSGFSGGPHRQRHFNPLAWHCYYSVHPLHRVPLLSV